MDAGRVVSRENNALAKRRIWLCAHIINFLQYMVKCELVVSLDLLLTKLYNYGAVSKILFSRETLRALGAQYG